MPVVVPRDLQAQALDQSLRQVSIRGHVSCVRAMVYWPQMIDQKPYQDMNGPLGHDKGLTLLTPSNGPWSASVFERDMRQRHKQLGAIVTATLRYRH